MKAAKSKGEILTELCGLEAGSELYEAILAECAIMEK